MTAGQMIDLLCDDMQNEYAHMLFYTHAAACLRGLPRLFLYDKLVEHARSELKHVLAFGHKISGLGGSPPACSTSFKATGRLGDCGSDLAVAQLVLARAIEMEREVVRNYHARHAQAEQLGDLGLVVFLEDQIEDSQHDVDELTQILVGM